MFIHMIIYIYIYDRRTPRDRGGGEAGGRSAASVSNGCLISYTQVILMFEKSTLPTLDPSLPISQL